MKHDNNIGFLRLVFASMVIIAHGYVLLGMAMSEPLARYTQTFTLGSVGVDGFFILSGYLITNSMIRSSSPGDYLLKRVLRIYPAFIVAYAIGGLVAMQAHPGYAPEWWRSLFLFHPPEAAATPDGSSFTANSPMWTIAYEFRCYLGVMILAAAGWLTNRRRMTQLTVVLWLLYLLIRIPQLWHVRAFKAPLPIDILLGNILPSIRFFAIFAIGMLIYLYREEIIPRLDGRVALACLAGIALTIGNMLLGESVFMLLGAVVIFWLAFRVDLGRLRQINDRWDISYGTYLYGWPIGNLLVSMRPEWNVGLFVTINLLGAWGMGAISWFLLERFVNMKTLAPLLRRDRGRAV